MARQGAVIFDFDGTLVDSAPYLAHAANLLMAELGRAPLDLDTIRSFIGNGIPKLVERTLVARDVPLVNFDDYVTRFKRLYLLDPTGRTVVFDKVRETLWALRDAGFATALVTNKAEDITQIMLPKLFLHRLFDVVIGGDTTTALKPDPLPIQTAMEHLNITKDNVVYIGDSHIDAEAAQNAGIDFGFYSGGYNHGDITQYKVSFAFDRFDALNEKIAALRQDQRR